MALRKAVSFLTFASLTALIIVLSCGSDDEPPVIFPTNDQINVFYISPDQAPPINGLVDEGSIWEAAQPAQLISDEDSDQNPSNRLTLVNIIALSDSTNLYLAATWKDGTRDVRYRQWIWDSVPRPNPWRQSFNNREDNFAVFFSTDTTWAGLSQSAEAIGPNCFTLCHEEDFVMVNETSFEVDGWYWRAGLTNPLGYAADLWFIDSLDADTLFNGMDDETSPGYIPNINFDSDIPIYWHKVDTTVVGDDTSFAISNADFLFAEDTVRYTPTDFGRIVDALSEDSVFVPSFVLSPNPEGSRWDVEAVGTFDEATGYWTVTFKRALNTGNADDFQFEIGEEYGFSAAVGDNAKNPHRGYDPVILKF